MTEITTGLHGVKIIQLRTAYCVKCLSSRTDSVWVCLNSPAEGTEKEKTVCDGMHVSAGWGGWGVTSLQKHNAFWSMI